jgi:hypothetical protein
MANVHTFNSYFFDLLKRCKVVARGEKGTSRDARVLLRAIKKNYRTYDAASPEHMDRWREACGAVAATYLTDHSFAGAEALEWYTDVPFAVVAALQPNPYNQHQYWTLFALLCRPDVDGEAVVACMRAIADGEAFEAAVAGLQNEAVRAPLLHLRSIYDTALPSSTSGGMDAAAASLLEDTALGRLAKEILDDPSVRDIQATLQGSASLTDMLADGANGGIAKLMSTVSQKMLSKLASGELKQENLLEDAVKFAGKLSGMAGGAGGILGDIGGLLSGAGTGGLDLSALMSAFGGAGGGASRGRTQQRRRASARKGRH